jgi:hypothetical protein
MPEAFWSRSLAFAEHVTAADRETFLSDLRGNYGAQPLLPDRDTFLIPAEPITRLTQFLRDEERALRVRYVLDGP